MALTVRLQEQHKEKKKANKMIIKCSRYYKISKCCDRHRSKGSDFSGEVQADFSERGIEWSSLLSAVAGERALGRFRSKKGRGEFGPSQASHTSDAKSGCAVDDFAQYSFWSIASKIEAVILTAVKSLFFGGGGKWAYETPSHIENDFVLIVYSFEWSIVVLSFFIVC